MQWGGGISFSSPKSSAARGATGERQQWGSRYRGERARTHLKGRHRQQGMWVGIFLAPPPSLLPLTRKLVVHRRMHKDAVGADASLASVTQRREHRPAGGQLQVGIGKHDEGRVTS